MDVVWNINPNRRKENKGMTPDQKAWFEYGIAWGEVKEAKRLLRKYEKTLRFTRDHGMREWSWYRRRIKFAWQKRSECQRKCGECKNCSLDEYGKDIDFCFARYRRTSRNQSTAGCKKFIHRKEGE